MTEQEPESPDLSRILVPLFQGVVYQDAKPELWQSLLELQARVRDYVAVLGLDLVLDEAEGYAYLRQREPAEGEPDRSAGMPIGTSGSDARRVQATDGLHQLPRLVRRRQLSFPVSLLLALLRKRLAEHDATGGDTRLILTREQIVETVRLFLPESANEAKVMDRINSHIKRVEELGFLRRLQGQEDHFEVRRILKAFVDAQWLAEFDQRLAAYCQHLSELEG